MGGAFGAYLTACQHDSSSNHAAGGSITAAVSVDDLLAREVLAACQRATAVEVVAVFDTEATKTNALESRLRAERDHPRVKLFWSSESLAVVRLAADGVLDELPDALWSAWPKQHRDEARRWLAFAARARVIVARPGLPPINQWEALATPGLARGSDAAIAIADPRFGTTNAHMAALARVWGEAAFSRWLDGLRLNGTRVLLGGNAATVEAVATGECAYAITDSDDALAAIARGVELQMFIPRTLPVGVRGGGTMLIPNTIGLVANGPGDAAAAAQVIEYLISPACEELIARSPSRNLPLNPLLAKRDDLRAFHEPDPLEFDPLAVSASAQAVALMAKRRLEGAPDQ